MELAVPTYDFDFDDEVKCFIQERAASYVEPKAKRSGGLSGRMHEALLKVTLTNTSAKETADSMGIPFDSLRSAKWRTKDSAIVGELRDFYGTIFLGMAETAIRRASTAFLLPDEKRGEFWRDLTEKRTPIKTDNLSPDSLEKIIGYVSMFMAWHREIQRLLLEHAVVDNGDMRHVLAALFDGAAQLAEDYLAPAGIRYDQIVRDLLPMVVMEMYLHCAVPLIGEFQRKIRTDYRRMKSVHEMGRVAGKWLAWAREGMAIAMAAGIVRYLRDHQAEDEESLIRGTADELSRFAALCGAGCRATGGEEKRNAHTGKPSARTSQGEAAANA